jgi:hypothetical protein
MTGTGTGSAQARAPAAAPERQPAPRDALRSARALARVLRAAPEEGCGHCGAGAGAGASGPVAGWRQNFETRKTAIRFCAPAGDEGREERASCSTRALAPAKSCTQLHSPRAGPTTAARLMFGRRDEQDLLSRPMQKFANPALRGLQLANEAFRSFAQTLNLG